ncbi:hypothetical protein BSL82_10140 [Tardibacter chloracetimidivorans]|uniref:Uncharacterized protein n=1 Tax=Tardibacter chloracetimidivorans TaxID=1921510 RepID=A0A1L3ZVH6_9SPHN|nr:hypothetical protein [Tardibacter chloracetimidivorans]API59632.1 hypothetical protein BSL82_10140 [Tardibacter chloracetimidivorans]
MAQKALSDAQCAEALAAVAEHGTVSAAATALGISRSALQNRLRVAAARGHAPGHFDSGVAPGYRMGKVTIQRNAHGDVERVWERQHPDNDAFDAAFGALVEELPRLAPVSAPASGNADLLNVYTLTDCHVGMLAWHREGGADWDLRIAERLLADSFTAMMAGAPRAQTAIVNQLGDFLHFDGLSAVTPTSGHLLDADGRFGKMVETAIRVLRRVVDAALAQHERVHLIMAEGNHDLASSVWLRKMFAALYENEPRLTVDDSELPYYAYQHGETMLAFHHGHLSKNAALPGLFAAQFPRMWGTTTKRYAHCGHRHHVEEKEHAGMTVVQHATLAARDAYAARGGWISERQAQSITYHTLFGKVATNIVTPEMLAA